MILVLVALSALISGVSDFFVIRRMEVEIKKKESCRIKRAFPALLHLCDEKIGNMLNSFGMWDDMVWNVKFKNVGWIKKMFEDDSMVTSQFDSYGIYDFKGCRIYVKNPIFSEKELLKIFHFIKENFKKGQPGKPAIFFYTSKNNIYHVGILPLCWNDGSVASYGFIYFAHEINSRTLRMYGQILSIRVKAVPGVKILKTDKLVYTFPMRNIDNKIVGMFGFYEDTLVINIFKHMNRLFILIVVVIFVIYVGAFSFVANSINDAMKKTFGSITSSLKRLSEGDFNAIEELDEFCKRDDELGNLAKNIQKIARQLSVNLSTDPLTGVYNRLYFSKKFEEEIERTKRTGRNLSFIIFDLDDFKKINDTYGHIAGDLVLKNFARSVLTAIRSIDIFARIGGEEFGLILPETDLKTAVQIAERIKKRLNGVYVPEIDKKVKITFSAGIAGYRDGDNMDSIFHRADVALYRAKQKGKNRIEVEE